MDAEERNGVHALLSVVWDAERRIGKTNPDAEDDPEWGYGYVWTACFDKAMDMIGLPEETPAATEYANNYGEWPEWGYCRDWVRDLFADLAWGPTAAKEAIVDMFIDDIEAIVADESNAPTTWFLGVQV